MAFPVGTVHSHSTQWSQILAQNHDFCPPHLHSTLPLWGSRRNIAMHDVWDGQTRMVWLPDGEKILTMWLLVLTESTNVTDRHTYRQTDTAWRHRPRLCAASRGNKHFVDCLLRTTNAAAYYNDEFHQLATVAAQLCVTLGGRSVDIFSRRGQFSADQCSNYRRDISGTAVIGIPGTAVGRGIPAWDASANSSAVGIQGVTQGYLSSALSLAP